MQMLKHAMLLGVALYKGLVAAALKYLKPVESGLRSLRAKKDASQYSPSLSAEHGMDNYELIRPSV